MKNTKLLAITVPEQLADHIAVLAAASTAMMGRRITVAELCRTALIKYLKFNEVQYSKNDNSEAVCKMYDALNKERKRPVYKKYQEDTCKSLIPQE
jgi:hypothetical protein